MKTGGGVVRCRTCGHLGCVGCRACEVCRRNERVAVWRKLMNDELAHAAATDGHRVVSRTSEELAARFLAECLIAEGRAR